MPVSSAFGLEPVKQEGKPFRIDSLEDKEDNLIYVYKALDPKEKWKTDWIELHAIDLVHHLMTFGIDEVRATLIAKGLID